MKKEKTTPLLGKTGKSAAAKRPPSTSTATGAGNGNGEKRDREEMLGEDEEDGENVHVKKRQKLQRVGSTTSLASQSTTGLGVSGLEMERSGSLDGSFVDDALGEEE